MNDPQAKRSTDQPPLALINARIIDPASGRDEAGAILIENGVITKTGPDIAAAAKKASAEIIDCKGHVLCPGLIDMRVFVGEPGIEHRETLASATQAAAAGGITTIITMPNTDPVIDDVALVDFIQRRARDTGIVNVHPMAAVTKGLLGEHMSEIGLLADAGAVGFTDGGTTIADTQLLRRILAYAKQFNALVSVHAQDHSLAGDGVMNEGEIATRLGLAGIPNAAEAIIVDRDLRLAELTQGRLHFSQLSCSEAVEAVRVAKKQGSHVTAGVSASHLLLNEHDIGSYRTFFKLSPPLRSEGDRLALIAGLADGSIDVVVSSHNPQSADTKRHPFAEAAAGAIGLETALPCLLSLHHNDEVALIRLLETMTIAPARLMGLERGTLAEGAVADMTLIDLGAPWIVDLADFKSKSKNSPFEAHKIMGRAIRTIVAGKTVYEYAA